MAFGTEFVLVVLVLPTLVEALVIVLWTRIAPGAACSRIAGAVAVAAAVAIVGYCDPPWEVSTPRRHWHFSAEIAIIAALLAPLFVLGEKRQNSALLGTASNARQMLVWIGRITATIAAALIVSWLIVPTWPNLRPSRPLWIAIQTVHLAGLTLAVWALAGRFSSIVVMVMLTVTSLFLTAGIFGLISISFGQSAMLSVTALFGCCLVSFIDHERMLGRSLAGSYAFLIGGWSYIAAIEPPKHPIYALMLIPWAPVVCLLVAWMSREFLRSRAAKHD